MKWKQSAITIAGGNQPGRDVHQLFWPQGIYIDSDRTIYVADYGNNRIIEWKSNAEKGVIMAGRSGFGAGNNQLNQATDVIFDEKDHFLLICDWGNKRVVRKSDDNEEILISDIGCYGLTTDKDGNLYVSDQEKDDVKQWKKGENVGRIVAGGNGKGHRDHQLNWPTFIFVDQEYSLYISDSNNHRVMKWKKDSKWGSVVAGGFGRGDSLSQLSNPQAIFVDQFQNIYVADFGNHRIMCWKRGNRVGFIVVGGNGQGEDQNQFDGPIGLSFDSEMNLFVVDHRNNRVQKFLLDSQ